VTYGRSTLVLVAAVGAAVLAGGMSSGAKRRPTRAACSPGRYLLAAPLVTGQGAPTTDAFEVGTTRIAIGDVCDGVKPKRYKATKRGTTVLARWRSCDGLSGKVTFKGSILQDCTSLRGTLRARRFRRQVQGRLSTCGDGVVDAGGGERCDPPAAGSCDDQCGRPPTFVSQTIGPQGGRIVSHDGRLTLDVRLVPSPATR
jgi:hypothetical protein